MNATVKEFKAFIERHPLLLKEVRQGERTLQEAFEQYVLLGEDDPSWRKYTADADHQEKKADNGTAGKLTKKIWKHIEQLDMNQLENHINDLNGAIDHIIVLMDQFKQYRNNQSGSAPFQSKD
ncbi:spore coat protein YlbD [Gracilibacillus alcaliphilus]|uniref:spore coat protein YlbD n=1 Tax=Gracilibacillus alcaliphilus TaxID=1401441 RepID=UPI00195E4912|nr:hypothetical protein [Gracilibacillus alcaliphilus]